MNENEQMEQNVAEKAEPKAEAKEDPKEEKKYTIILIKPYLV